MSSEYYNKSNILYQDDWNLRQIFSIPENGYPELLEGTNLCGPTLRQTHLISSCWLTGCSHIWRRNLGSRCRVEISNDSTTYDSFHDILERRCSGAKVWELDVEEDILEFESAFFFLKNASIIFGLPIL